MTMFKPNLQLEHLSVFSRGKEAYSEDFHPGLNIIRGENSSGKSTIMDFIFYALGGDFLESQWRESALNCDSVLAGVRVNGNELTLSRDVDPKSSRPMRIFLGSWQDAIQSAAEGWERYPYARGEKESFSQVLFRFLGLPEVQYDNQNTKITMHQILRLMYSDQLSSVEKIFKPVPFDDALTRQSIGDLLCGAYSDRYYRAKIRQREATIELTDIDKRKKTLIQIYGKDGHPLTIEWLEQEIKALNDKIEDINAQIEVLEKKIFDGQFDDRLTLNDQEERQANVIELQQSLSNLERKLSDLQFQSADSSEFIKALERRIEQIVQSSTVVEQFTNLTFQFCPSCLAPVDSGVVENSCSLCKTPYDHTLTRKRSLKLLNDYERQLKQSITLQEERQEIADRLRGKIERTRALWEQATAAYQVAVRTPTTEARMKLRALNRDAGYAYKELEETALKREIIEELAALSEKGEHLNRELDALSSVIKSEAARTKTQIANARQQIEAFALGFLHRDLERQSTFVKASKFDFEFDGDRLSVNGESYFSASSMVYMRNSFFASFLFAAASDPSFSHPRFLLMDTIEDKGMEQERSRNFQRLIAERSEEAKSDHQIVIATSMIAPDLDISKYTVGDYYTHENRTLKLR